MSKKKLREISVDLSTKSTEWVFIFYIVFLILFLISASFFLIKNREKRQLLERCAATALNSKLVASHREFFAKMIVDAVYNLDEDLTLNLIGIKKESGGSLGDSYFVDGVAFKKTFSYAGFEQQPKKFTDPKIIALNIELELKSEKDNAEIRIENPDVSSPP